MRNIISKIRCSDHSVEIERGRHLNIPGVERICKTCAEGVIEDEEHFLLNFKIYQPIREKHHMYQARIQGWGGAGGALAPPLKCQICRKNKVLSEFF
jgi:hypothetical protein